ncbi:MAG: PKD domain-containing protein [Methanobacteriota archaeon]
MKRAKAILCIVLVLLMISSGLFFIADPSTAAVNRNIYVKNTYAYNTGDGSADRPYRSIQHAIDVAVPGDTIYVFEGTYNETLQINKAVSIIGLDQKNTSIQIYAANPKPRYLIEITADYVTLEELNISDPEENVRVALIYVQGDYTTIQATHIHDAAVWGVYLDSSSDNTIGYNAITDIKGVYAYYSNNNVFSKNSFRRNNDAAIKLYHVNQGIIYNNVINKSSSYSVYADECSNLNFSSNKIGNGSLDGIKLLNGNSNILWKNVLNKNKGNGVFVSSSSCTIWNNTFTRNQIGIELQGSDSEIFSNKIKNSTIYGLHANTGTQDNVMYLNQFRDNPTNALENGHNQWYSGEQGNYWDDYNEVDRNLDLMGDTPYEVPNGGRDLYPLGYFLKPPRRPTIPYPRDSASEVGLSVTLKVNVSDPDSTYLNVYFYRATDDALMGYQRNVRSSKQASCSFTLPFQTTFAWYAIVNDSKLENRSNIYIFTTRTIPPTNKKPVADPGGPYEVNIGESFAFDSSGSRDPDGTLQFYRWNFGDGTSEILARSPTHSYPDGGRYTVTLTVVDNEGRSDTNTTTVAVGSFPKNQDPVANGTFLSGVDVSKPVFFNGTASTDSDGTIVSYLWNFGDGTTGSGVTTTHTYTKEGTYWVTLTVTDDAGGTNQAYTSVTLKAATPGFELLLVVGALLGVLLWRRRKGTIK